MASEQRLPGVRCDRSHLNLHHPRRAGRVVRGPVVGASLHRLYSRHVLRQVLPAMHEIPQKELGRTGGPRTTTRLVSLNFILYILYEEKYSRNSGLNVVRGDSFFLHSSRRIYMYNIIGHVIRAGRDGLFVI